MELIEQRAKTHGDFTLTASVACKLQDVGHMSTPGSVLPPEVRQAHQMIMVKLARIACGDTLHADHWRDIAGYAMLVVKTLERREADGA